MKTTGFTLLELTIALAFCAFLVTMVLPFFSITDHLRVRSEVDRIFMCMKSLRLKALADGKNYTLKWDVLKLSDGIIYGAQTDVFGPPSSALYPIKDFITFPRHTMTCYADGTCDAGTVYLTSVSKTVTYALSVAIDSFGYIRRYHYRSGKWRLLL